MEEHKKLIVVPWDFSDVAGHALAHAAKIAHMVGNSICLLHVMDLDTKQKAEDINKAKLQQIAEESSTKYNRPVSFQIVRGKIFSSISEFANGKGASLIVMGTHGIKGMQKLTGSWALKVIVKAKMPCIVVQEPPPGDERYQNILFPVDFKTENKEKLNMAIFMGKYFDSKIHMLSEITKDKSLLRKTRTNLNFAVKYLIQNNIEYEIHEIPHQHLAHQIIEFGHKINADLILITTTKNITLADYVLGASEQSIIANSSKIPVCCINPRASFAKVGQFMYG